MECTTNRQQKPQSENQQFRVKKLDFENISKVNEMKRRFVSIIEGNFFESNRKFIIDDDTKKVLSFVFNWVVGIGIEQELNKGLFFSGDKGLGKSTIMKSTSQFITEIYGVSSTFITANAIARLYRGKSDFDTLNLDRLFKCKLLFIDDIGTEDLKVYDSNPIQEIVRERYDLKKITSFSTNDSTPQLIEKYTQSIEDKISHMTYLIPFKGVSKR